MTDILPGWSDRHRAAPRLSVVVGAAVRREDRLLLVRQTYGTYWGQWVLPAGYVEPGERFDEAAAREAAEVIAAFV